MKRLWYLTAFVPFLLAAAWDAALEADPADTDPVSAGAGEIRDTRSEVRQRAETDLCWGSFDTTGCPAGDEGRLREGGARAFHDTSAPTVLNAEDRAGSDALDEGRLWADSDTPSATVHRLQVYDGSGWEDVEAGYAAALTDATDSDDQVLAGSYNLIYNGGFEATSGSGSASSTTVPAGWDLDSTTPTIAYTDPSGDVRWGDGYHVTVTGAGAANEQIRQVLTNLAASTTYKIIARVAEGDASDICRLNTTGASVDLSDTDSDGTSWQTLSGTFTTAAALDTVDINLVTVADGDICHWDHVGVYQVGDTTTDRDEVNYNDGAVRVRAEYPTSSGSINCSNSFTGTCGSAATGLTVTVNPPAPGYIIQITASVDLFVAAGSAGRCEARLHDGTSSVDGAVLELTDMGGAGTNEMIFKMYATNVNPTPGTPITYTVGVNDTASNCFLGVDYASWIEALLIPTR